MKRREFLSGMPTLVAGTAALTTLGIDPTNLSHGVDPGTASTSSTPVTSEHAFNGPYRGSYLDQVAFPLGGIGAGMFCVEGNGAITKFSFRHRPDLERETRVFAGISMRGDPALARVLEGPVPTWKLRPRFPEQDDSAPWGLPRFREAVFDARFPFAHVQLTDPDVPVDVTLTGWSPFAPNDADNASLPAAALEYRLTNRGRAPLTLIFSFNAANFLATPPKDPTVASKDRIRATAGGFILYGAGSEERPWDEGSCAFWVDAPKVTVNHAWILDEPDHIWQQFAGGLYVGREPQADRSAVGASLFVPLSLPPGEARTVTVNAAWYVPKSNLYEPTHGIREDKKIAYAPPADRYTPWYAGRFSSLGEVIEYWRTHAPALRQATDTFSRTLFDSTLPPEAMEAVAANLSILKSPTVFRQTDGRLWGWEGSTLEHAGDVTGISGTTTHVWNYAQSIPHLFPALERTLREAEFGTNMNDEGMQYCRTPLPIRAVEPGHWYPDGPAADGQLGAIVRVYREWRISGDDHWLRAMWPRVRASLDYCIRTWDPAQHGVIEEPHLTTYDADFWDADSFCTSLYLGALKAVTLMAAVLGQPTDQYTHLLESGVQRMEGPLFNGQYFLQQSNWQHLKATFPPKYSVWTYQYRGSPDLLGIEQQEGPAGQYGAGCLSDGAMGVWLAEMSGIDDLIDRQKVTSHLRAVHQYNLRQDLTDHTSFLRVGFACGDEPGLLLCTWPGGKRPSIPMMYSDEIWTGVEYQVASHLIAHGEIDRGLDIVRAVRRRYDGRVRSPFCEVEAGYWYARAMSSYALLQAFSGARYDAVERVLHLTPRIRGNFRCFLSTATGYGTVGVKDGKPFVEVVSGTIPFQKIAYVPAGA